MTQQAGWSRFAGVLVLITAATALSSCSGSSDGEPEQSPAVVDEVQGSDVKRVTFTPQAARRLGIQTAAVSRNGRRSVIPYSAVLYAPTGETWAYVNPRGLTFQRRVIVVDHIDGGRAVLSEGLAPGTRVATVGVPELFGAETGIGGEH
jgi:hypothetical protein